ncbi:hypothetical protein C7974DRAFT_448132 [Boeremia exigua]|uniref:uncharacterized protein n=1 Tax=Boeremia exigua TaxID=749465 RepID=UPI001E8D8FAA|nr:uncharacterized protein C7974DRAFT_448132 [Boeremia exigua]KAH6643132.1 hypothetical protein C7974DRAFT_448132 [Boeremia exigua]
MAPQLWLLAPRALCCVTHRRALPLASPGAAAPLCCLRPLRVAARTPAAAAGFVLVAWRHRARAARRCQRACVVVLTDAVRQKPEKARVVHASGGRLRPCDSPTPRLRAAMRAQRPWPVVLEACLLTVLSDAPAPDVPPHAHRQRCDRCPHRTQ